MSNKGEGRHTVGRLDLDNERLARNIGGRLVLTRIGRQLRRDPITEQGALKVRRSGRIRTLRPWVPAWVSADVGVESLAAWVIIAVPGAQIGVVYMHSVDDQVRWGLDRGVVVLERLDVVGRRGGIVGVRRVVFVLDEALPVGLVGERCCAVRELVTISLAGSGRAIYERCWVVAFRERISIAGLFLHREPQSCHVVSILVEEIGEVLEKKTHFSTVSS